MLASISPLGERARGNRWITTAGFYVASSVAGGATTGSLVGGLGALVGIGSTTPVALVIAATVCVAAASLDLGGIRPPGPRRQVNERWLDEFRGWVYGTGFGFQLGLGVVTIVSTWSMWAALALAFASGSAAAGLAIGATFGLVRAVPLLAVAGADSPARLRGVHTRLARFRRPTTQAGSAMLLATAVTLLAVAA
jgi:hypothetical protein